MPLYCISGLSVAADMMLPGAIPLPGPVGAADVRIRRRSVPAGLTMPTQRGPGWQLDGRQFLLTLDGVGRFLAQDGAVLDLQPDAGADPADCLPFLLGTAFGALLHQRGDLVLHAAAVTTERDGAIALCAPSGGGKSTLAAALCHAGGRFLSDDVTAVRLDTDGRPRLQPDGRTLKLHDGAVRHLGLQEARRDAVRAGFGKYYVDPPGGMAADPVPLAAIYLLHDQQVPDTAGIERLTPLEAAQALLNQSYRRRLALAMAGRGAQMATTAAILRQVPVYRLTRPRDLGRLDETAASLLAHRHGLG